MAEGEVVPELLRRLAAGNIRRADCGYWERGLDCGFNEKGFHLTCSILWGLSALVFVGQAFCSCSRQRESPSGIARYCLLLTGLSASLSSVDSGLAIGMNVRSSTNPEGRWRYDPGGVSCLGSIFLMWALWLFADLWCSVVGALERKYDITDRSHRRIERRLKIIRIGYLVVAIIHTWMSLPMFIASVHAKSFYDTMMVLYMVWCFISICIVYTILAVLMLYVTVVPMKDYEEGGKKQTDMGGIVSTVGNQTTGPDLGSLRKVTRINLAEQIMYNVLLISVSILYLTQLYNDKGQVQATVMGMYQALMWVAHVQVLFFFVVCGPKDPLYSRKIFVELMEEAQGADWDLSPSKAAAMRATTNPDRPFLQSDVELEDGTDPSCGEAYAVKSNLVSSRAGAWGGEQCNPTSPSGVPVAQPADKSFWSVPGISTVFKTTGPKRNRNPFQEMASENEPGNQEASQDGPLAPTVFGAGEAPLAGQARSQPEEEPPLSPGAAVNGLRRQAADVADLPPVGPSSGDMFR